MIESFDFDDDRTVFDKFHEVFSIRCFSAVDGCKRAIGEVTRNSRDFEKQAPDPEKARFENKN